MKRKWIVFAALALLFLWAAVYFWGPSSAPPGQKPLSVLSPNNLGEFESAFDAGADTPRLVLLVSPT